MIPGRNGLRSELWRKGPWSCAWAGAGTAPWRRWVLHPECLSGSCGGRGGGVQGHTQQNTQQVPGVSSQGRVPTDRLAGTGRVRTHCGWSDSRRQRGWFCCFSGPGAGIQPRPRCHLREGSRRPNRLSSETLGRSPGRGTPAMDVPPGEGTCPHPALPVCPPAGSERRFYCGGRYRCH